MPSLRFIRDRAFTLIGVEDVVRAVAVPPRTLERRFRAAVGRGLGEEIRRAPIDRARVALVEPAIPTDPRWPHAGLPHANTSSRVPPGDRDHPHGVSPLVPRGYYW